jgi:hypothetical protein
LEGGKIGPRVGPKTKGFPKAIASVLEAHPAFKSAELIDAFLERQVDLGTAGRHSQTDLLAVVGVNEKLAIVAVEGKAGETFGDYDHQWLDKSETKETRLKGLCKALGLTRDMAKPLRYQLLHRAASAVYEARRYRTHLAVLLIHSFSDDQSGFQDFSAFVSALGGPKVAPKALVGPFSCEGISLYAGWVNDQAPKDGAYLDALRNYASKLSEDCERIQAWCDAQQPSR